MKIKQKNNISSLLLQDSDIPFNCSRDEKEYFDIPIPTFHFNINNNNKNFYVKCNVCESWGICQGSGYICSCKFNVYEIYNLCQCVSCNEITPFITNNKNEIISLCHPFINIYGVKNLKKIKKR